MLLTVPTIMHGGATLLGILTRGGAGVARGLALDDTQWALFRAGHAHAGVWAILSLFLQVLLDATTLSTAPRLVAKPATPIGAICVSGGFFGLAFLPGLRPLLYFGAVSMMVALVLTAIGLLRAGTPRVTVTSER
jgi:membrane-bound metal-dependent hydrolase YbcI (DUF457 family)